ncbi:NAD(P)HX epimerase [Nonlabens tegetincola]|uniref:Bifunctional NAD(P)H-hydrate repair enzyme n=1 Tax=Nonlabens tegetincola TaxID=323273 RepID=A0A090QQ81_9FLAO|nr:NAD(P)H-hydrate dehydratase [Nonlabens tegetincola]GAK97641.1 NAD(P)HX epimerase [Nonlabens tegetincola]
MKILSGEQLAQADASTIQKQQISSIDLMERVATLVFERLHQRLNGAPVPIKVFCGIGNNGGDGLAIARHLIQHGYHVTTYVTNCSKKRSKDFLVNYDRIKEVTKDWPILLSCKDDFPEIGQQDIVIDAIFGTGINRPIDGWMAEFVEHINNSRAFKVAVDMPSGLFADQAQNDAPVIRANHTFTFQTPKLSFFLPETGNLVGTYEVINIGLDPEYMMQVQPLANLVDKDLAQRMYKNRNPFSHKGDYGHVLVMAGSEGKMGAAVLASGAAINAGAGKVTALIPEDGNTILQCSVPEVMSILSSGESHVTNFDHELQNYVLCVGPGLGLKDDTFSAFAKAISKQASPVVIDADGINLLSRDLGLLKKIPENSILTPHDGELKGLIGEWKGSYDKLSKAQKFSMEHKVILVLKGAFTFTVTPQGMFVNDSGNPGMATAGSGDVLSGVIAAFLAQKYDPITATLFGVYLHGASGDLAVQTYAHEGLKASIISNFIGPAILNLFRQPQQQPPQQQ